jgi:hypothetical protein
MKIFARMHMNKLPTVLPTLSRNPSFTAFPLHQIKIGIASLEELPSFFILRGRLHMDDEEFLCINWS